MSVNALKKQFSKIPNEKLLVETDSPFLSPVPFRGKLNEPSNVYYVSEYLANFYNVSIKEFEVITDRNFYSLFKKAIHYKEISHV